jgi:hypothetical protein
LITADQLLCHAIGDYILQSHWMATEKTKRSVAALAHVAMYAIPFLFLRPSWSALVVIVSTHFVIDRWRLARFVVWAKNWLCPFWVGFYIYDTESSKRSWEGGYNDSWPSCAATGYPHNTPVWLAVWLLIIADNTMHIAINGLALKYL